eukprot:XP_011427438.1 PREDICTED: uncharacterized protein LOC105328328 isoform X2 [Crassostrea gigas]
MSGFSLVDIKGLIFLIRFLLLSVSVSQHDGQYSLCTSKCLRDPCVTSLCTYPGARCLTNYCGGCAAVWLDGDRRLTTEECGGTEAPSAPSAAPITKCLDTLSNCATYGRSACLPPYTFWARKHCPLFCGFCTVDTTPTTATAPSTKSTKDTP